MEPPDRGTPAAPGVGPEGRWAAQQQRSFAEQLADPSLALAADLSAASDTLLVVFGGIRGRFGMPSYEFLKVTSPLGVKRAFLRDTRSCWYQRGVEGLGDTIEQTASSLRDFLRESRARRVVLCGNSAGGYAALLFGRLVGADEVLAFAPRTFLNLGLRLRHGDFRYSRALVRLLLTGGVDPRYRDLREVLSGGSGASGPTQVHYSRGNRIDGLHARRLAGLPGMELCGHEHAGHGLVASLRDSGALSEILSRAVSPR